ncbi:MAG: prepilin-type N-terminal cleavage/methylation domain-containing protein [Clostridia bacterium]|nr:prepilin-type N-terminal cleavage/methylation domain-containing protein [Clostridia bacterium]
MIKSNKRGVTIAEAMIAMLIILVVSASAVTLITAYSKQSSAMLQRNEALTIAENTLESFKISSSYGEFIKCMPMVTSLTFQEYGYSNQTAQRAVDSSDPSAGTKTVTVSESATIIFQPVGFTVTVRVTFEETRAYYSVSVRREGGEQVFDVDNYMKALEASS